MSVYAPGKATQLSVGTQATLVTSSGTGAGAATSKAVVIAREPGTFGMLSVFNSTDQNATLQISAADADAGFLDTSLTVASGDAAEFNSVIGPFVRFLFAAATTTGSLIVAREKESDSHVEKTDSRLEPNSGPSAHLDQRRGDCDCWSCDGRIRWRAGHRLHF